MTNQEFIESIRLEGEEWKDVVGFEGSYIVSSLGRVASLPRITMRNNKPMKLQGKIMKPIIDRHGYEYISLRKDNIYFRIFIHRIVALAFLDNPNKKKEIDHIDTNPRNNNIHNLRWCTISENRLNPITLKKLINKSPLYNEVPIVGIGDKEIIYFRSYGEAVRNGFNINGIRRCINKGQSFYNGYKWMLLSDYESLVSMSKNELPNPDNDYPQ